jgi:hypothetical protein
MAERASSAQHTSGMVNTRRITTTIMPGSGHVQRVEPLSQLTQELKGNASGDAR